MGVPLAMLLTMKLCLIPSRAIRALCMDVQFPIKGLKLDSLFYVKAESDWCIKLFEDIRGAGIYCDSNLIHVECLKLWFMQLIQDELIHVAEHWNLHRIRPCRNSDSLAGRPDTIFSS